jgi:hypothetical protein
MGGPRPPRSSYAAAAYGEGSRPGYEAERPDLGFGFGERPFSNNKGSRRRLRARKRSIR